MYPRFLEARVVDALLSRPAVVLVGPRQAGKTTLAQRLAKKADYTTLDQASVLAAVRSDPDGFAESFSASTTIIDEVQRDLRDLADIRHVLDVPRLLAVVADHAPAPLNVARISSEIGLPRKTIDRYLALLEQAFLVWRLPAWHASVRYQQVRSPKLLLTDSALMGHLLGLSPQALNVWGRRHLGRLLESFVAVELLKQSPWSSWRPRPFHWRTGDGAEVDVVLRSADGRIAGVEVKATATVAESDFRPLERLRQAVGRSFVRGIVLYTGSRALPFGDGLEAWPVSAVWSP